MDIAWYVVAFIVAIGVLVTVHEFGHFWVARRLGVKVLRFSVGFGKPLLSWRRGTDDTEYVIAMVPLGGYVKMLDEREGAAGSVATAISSSFAARFSRSSICSRDERYGWHLQCAANLAREIAGITTEVFHAEPRLVILKRKEREISIDDLEVFA